MNRRLLVGLIVVVAGIAVGWYVFGGGRVSLGGALNRGGMIQVSPTPAAGPQTTTGGLTAMPGAAGSEKGGVSERTVVTYTESGFAPNPVTIKVGMTVTFVNESSGGMWVASDVHPTHQLLPGFDELKAVEKGGTYDYAFVKVGTWTYHNHLSPNIKGTVIVTR